MSRLFRRGLRGFLLGSAAAVAVGCCHPSVTAVSLSPMSMGEPEGIPFYLPKPLLIISKNFRYIEEAKVGLTDSAPIPQYFDDQSKYADVNARTSFSTNGAGAQASAYGSGTPGSGVASKPTLHSGGAPVVPGTPTPNDGLTPETFFTYQIVFVPDLSQKYGLKIKGGVGEIRAAMNLVNGWQFTGLGPFYMKDSSTAQNVLAGGIAANLAASGVADVLNSLADLRKPPAGDGKQQAALVDADTLKLLGDRIDYIKTTTREIKRDEFLGYAEIHVYEQTLGPDGTTCWHEIAQQCFNREYLQKETTREYKLKDTGKPQTAIIDTKPKSSEPKSSEPPKPPGTTGAAADTSGTPQAALVVEAQRHAGVDESLQLPTIVLGAPAPPAERDDHEMIRSILGRTLNAQIVPGGQPQAAVIGGTPQAAVIGGTPQAAAVGGTGAPSVIVMPGGHCCPKTEGPLARFVDRLWDHCTRKSHVQNAAVVGVPTVDASVAPDQRRRSSEEPKVSEPKGGTK